jgi:hypothetical protein
MKPLVSFMASVMCVLVAHAHPHTAMPARLDSLPSAGPLAPKETRVKLKSYEGGTPVTTSKLPANLLASGDAPAVIQFLGCTVTWCSRPGISAASVSLTTDLAKVVFAVPTDPLSLWQQGERNAKVV